MVTGEVEVAVAVGVCGVTAGGEGDKGPVGPHDSRRGARWSVRAALTTVHDWDRLLVANGRQGEVAVYGKARCWGLAHSLHGNMRYEYLQLQRYLDQTHWTRERSYPDFTICACLSGASGFSAVVVLYVVHSSIQ